MAVVKPPKSPEGGLGITMIQYYLMIAKFFKCLMM